MISFALFAVVLVFGALVSGAILDAKARESRSRRNIEKTFGIKLP